MRIGTREQFEAAVRVAIARAPHAIDAADAAEFAVGVVSGIIGRVVRTVDEEDGLTDRQREIAIMYARGAQIGDIATRLNLTKSGVSAHLHNVYRILDVHTRSALTVYGIVHGWLEEEEAKGAAA